MSICIDNPLIVIGSLSLTELVTYDMTYSKLWKDAGRNMNGDMSACFIGIFPNIKAETIPMDQSTVGALCDALDQAFFTLTFWDPARNMQRTAEYYASDYTVKLESRIQGKYGTVEFSLIPTKKKT